MNSSIALTIAGLEDAKSLDDLRPVLEAYLQEQGFSGYSVIIADQYGLNAEKISAFSSFPAHVLAKFNDEDFYLIDPLSVRARNSFAPFIWSKAINPRYLEPEIQRIYAQAGQWRINDGVTVPVWHPHYRNYRGNVGYSTDSSSIENVNLDDLALVSYVLFEKVEQFFNPQSMAHIYPSLSDVEIKLLRLAATGMSSKNIEAELGLAKRTIDYHFSQATQKLGAKSRIHAIIRAYRLNFLEPFKPSPGDC